MSGEKGLGDILGEIEALDKIISILDKADKTGTALLKKVQSTLNASALFTTYYNPQGTSEEVAERRHKLMSRIDPADLRKAMRSARIMARAIESYLADLESTAVVDRIKRIRKEQGK